MSIHTGTVLGFLASWGPKATDEEIDTAVGILLAALAKRGTPSRLKVGESDELNFTREAVEHFDGSPINWRFALLGPQEKAKTS